MITDLIDHITRKGNRSCFFITVFLCSLLFGKTAVTAQDAKEPAAKLSFTMKLGSLLSNGNRSIYVHVSRKVNKKIFPVDDLRSPVNIYLNEIKELDPVTGIGRLGKIYLDNGGEGELALSARFNQLTAGMHEFTFIAKMQADPVYEDAEEQLTVADAKAVIDFSDIDSVKSATATLLTWKDNSYVPMPQAELKLCIKRTFNYLPFGESGATTDSAGMISGILPLDIPGNSNGTLTIAARLEDDGTYGTVEVTKDVPWPVLPKVNPPGGRTLWSQGDNAPLLLVISSVTIIVVIWGTIFYLVYLLVRIKKLGNTV